MAWIEVPEPNDANPALQASYAEVATSRGEVADILRVHGIQPPAMTAHLQFYRQIMFGRSDLSRLEREAIAVAVSSVNGCHY